MINCSIPIQRIMLKTFSVKIGSFQQIQVNHSSIAAFKLMQNFYQTLQTNEPSTNCNQNLQRKSQFDLLKIE